MTDEPLDLTRIDRADVYKSGELAAHLTRTPEGNAFAYTDDWLRSGGPPLASTLPVTNEIRLSPGGAVPAYFAGLLPEGRRLAALRRQIKTSADDELSLLLGVGADSIGDVTVFPSGAEPTAVGPLLEVTSWPEIRFTELLATLDVRVDRVGLPGVQDKVSLTMLNLPVTAAGKRYLLKLNPPEFPHLVENEHFFLEAARATGIDTVEANLVHDADGNPGLVITRFDRVHDPDGTPRSLAVEDGCQVLGLHPEAKYRVSTEQVLGRLTSLCTAPVPAARVFLQQIVFAYLTGNGDAHAKNFSILQDRFGRWHPAPAYDLPSSQPYGDHTLALRVADSRQPNIPGRRWVALGVELGLREAAARRAVTTVADRVDAWRGDLDDLPYPKGTTRKLRAVIDNRLRMLGIL